MGKHVANRPETGFRSTDSNEAIPFGWIEVTRKTLAPGELVRRSFMGPVVQNYSPDIIGIRLDGVPMWFARAAWTVTEPIPYPRIEDFQ